MVSLGPLAFVVPWALVVLVLLPLLWWLLKVVPPMPRRVSFPAIRLLFGLDTDRRAAESTPLWLILLRITLAALLVLAVAHPLVNPNHRTLGSGDMLVVIDDGWASGRDWTARLAAARTLLDLAERQDRNVVLLTTARADESTPLAHSGLLLPQEAGQRLSALAPRPWPVDRGAAQDALAGLDGIGQVFWIADGVAGEGDEAFAQALESIGDLTVMTDREIGGALVLLPPGERDGAIVLIVRRADRIGERAVWVAAEDGDGALVARQQIVFEDGAAEAEALLAVPPEMRNRIARLAIENEPGAAAVVLLDQRWRRPPVGIVAPEGLEANQPLLAPAYFVERAVEGAADLRRGSLAELLARPPAVIMMADIGTVPETERGALEDWMEGGGVLVRFAGPLFAQDTDDLVPVEIRGRERSMGGAMSWSSAQRIAPLEPGSPFAGLAVPQDVLIDTQVLAEPTGDLAAHTWARLEDGTPLVTAQRRGEGWLVMVHTSANTQWTNLPISVLFVDMMRRLVDLSQGAGAELGDEPLPVLQALDGFGVLGPPPPGAGAIAANAFDEATAGPRHPPGIYGTFDLRRSLNLGSAIAAPEPLILPDGVAVTGFERQQEFDLRPVLLGLAALLALVEIWASMALRGLAPGLRTGTRLAALPLLFLLAMPGAPHAQEDAPTGSAIPEAALEVRFAYIETGDEQVDRASFAGLRGLSAILNARTSVEPGEPVGVDPETDELILYPLVYWPITQTQPVPSGLARARLDAFLAAGGILLVDTRDANEEMQGVTATGPNAARLPELLGGINVPPLMRVPSGHVLNQSYYLLTSHPGRWTGGSLWVEQDPAGLNDGVSAIVIGANDWASAWALNEQMQPLFAVVPGGERQREMAFRFGVNLVMYAMTGNYKADAVHLPSILERLGQ